MNPSIHFDGETWRCVLRCADYGMPGGVTVRPPGVTGSHQTKNAMVIFDPDGWKPTAIYRMQELDEHPRQGTAMVKGFEDMRLFMTERDGLQGICASLHLERPKQAKNCPPEQVIVSFDEAYNIIDAKPIRGPWSSTAQKNWVPFDDAESPMFLYNIERGSLYNENGPIDGLPKAGLDHLGEKNRFGTEIQLRRTTQPVMAGRTLPPSYRGLRGGSQLVHLEDGTWLGIGHEMCLVRSLKYYWHVWYQVNGDGQLLSKSVPMKLAPEGIEFVAGLAVVGDRVVTSFGVDDMHCRIGETSLSAVLELLKEVDLEPVEPVKQTAATARPIEIAADKLPPRKIGVGLRARSTSAPAASYAQQALEAGPHVKMRPIPKAIDPEPIERARPRTATGETRSRSLPRLADGQRVPTAILSQGVAHVPLATPATISAQPGVIGPGTTTRLTPAAKPAGAIKPVTNVSDPPALSPEDAERIEAESKRLSAAFQMRTASMDVMSPTRPGALSSGTSAPTKDEETLGKAVLERAIDYASAARRNLGVSMLLHFKAQLMVAIDVYSNLHIDEKGQAK